MTTPLFITISKRLSPNWLDAFPQAELQVGLPEKFDRYNDSIIYLDFSGLDSEQKKQWLTAAVETNRKVVVLSLVPNNEEALEIIQQGAVGYGHSLTSGTQLREINLVVSHDGLWVGRKLMKRIMGSLDSTSEQSLKNSASSRKEQLLAQLSKRESAVAQEVARGASNQEISEKLTIKERTVKAHITSIFNKLNVRNRVGLALLLNNIDISDDAMEN